MYQQVCLVFDRSISLTLSVSLELFRRSSEYFNTNKKIIKPQSVDGWLFHLPHTVSSSTANTAPSSRTKIENIHTYMCVSGFLSRSAAPLLRGNPCDHFAFIHSETQVNTMDPNRTRNRPPHHIEIHSWISHLDNATILSFVCVQFICGVQVHWRIRHNVRKFYSKRVESHVEGGQADGLRSIDVFIHAADGAIVVIFFNRVE